MKETNNPILYPIPYPIPYPILYPIPYSIPYTIPIPYPYPIPRADRAVWLNTRGAVHHPSPQQIEGDYDISRGGRRVRHESYPREKEHSEELARERDGHLPYRGRNPTITYAPQTEEPTLTNCTPDTAAAVKRGGQRLGEHVRLWQKHGTRRHTQPTHHAWCWGPHASFWCRHHAVSPQRELLHGVQAARV